jgi:hypothetical protein
MALCTRLLFGETRGIAVAAERSIPMMSSALATFRRLGDGWNVGVTLHRLGDNAREVGNWTEAIAAYLESLAHPWTQRDPLGVADALLRQTQVLVALGEAGSELRRGRRGLARTNRHHGLRTAPTRRCCRAWPAWACWRCRSGRLPR